MNVICYQKKTLKHINIILNKKSSEAITLTTPYRKIEEKKMNRKLTGDEKQIIKSYARISFKKGYQYNEFDLYKKLDDYEIDRDEIEEVLNKEYKKLAEKEMARINKKYDEQIELAKSIGFDTEWEEERREEEIKRINRYIH